MRDFTRRDLLVGAGRLGACVVLAPAFRTTAAYADSSRDPRLRRLAQAVQGPVITRGSSLYESVRLPFNSRFANIRPLAVVQPLSREDVRQIVLWSAREGVRIAARSGGHSYAGYSTTPGVVVDLSRINRVVLTSDGRAAIGAGARLIDIDATLAKRGRALPAGSCPTVGIGGLTLGGGFGFASRAWGLTCDNLVDLEIVAADGRVLTCDPRRHEDLFWACRGGGGGNFGIVTRFRFRTHRVSRGSYFVAIWPWDALEEVVRRYQSWGPHAPDGLGTICRLATGPGEPTLEVFGQYLGPEQALRKLVGQLTRGLPRADLTVGTESWLDLQRRWAGCLGKDLPSCRTPHPMGFAAASDYVRAPLSSRAIGTMRHWIERRQGARGALLFDAYGGAVNRVAPSATAFVHRRELGSFQYFSSWGDSAAASSTRAWIHGFSGAMKPFVSGFAYQNYIDPELSAWEHAYYGSNLARLSEVKARYDEHGLFRFPQAIPARR